MAVVIASNLRKELAGSVLFDGVSFKVERRDRLALAGPNGAGKTTLLRLLAGETDLHGGELAFQKSARIALHDQRPPLKLGLTLRDYVLAAIADTEDRPRLELLAVREMPHSGKPAELLAEAGIDADHIADAARQLVGAVVSA